MDWIAFFEQTRVAAKVDSLAKLAPLLGVTDGAISHYRVGRRIPQVCVVAEALKIQGHPQPEKAAIQIMKNVALSSTERTFWKKLAASAAAVLLVACTLPGIGANEAKATANAGTGYERAADVYIMRSHGRNAAQGFLTVGWLIALWLKWRFSTRKAGPDCIEAFAC